MKIEELTKLAAMNQLLSEWEFLDDISKSHIVLLATTGNGDLQTFFKQLYVILSTVKM